MQPDSLAGIWTLVRNTPKETCQVLIWIGCHQSLRNPVQTWQVLLEPTQPDSLAGIWNLVRNTPKETCQVLVFIDCHQSQCYPVQTWQVLPGPMIIESRTWTRTLVRNTPKETCQVLIFFPSQISAADWFAFSRYLRLHALYESLRVWFIMYLFFNTLNLPVCGGDCLTSLAVTTCWRWFHELAMIGVS